MLPRHDVLPSHPHRSPITHRSATNMPTSTCSSASKTQSGLTHDPMPTSNQQRKHQLSNLEEKQLTTKRGKKTPSDDDDSNNDDDTEGKRKEVVEDREALKGAKSGKRAAKAAKCVPTPFFFNDSNIFQQKKGPRSHQGGCARQRSAASKEATTVRPPPSFFIDFLHFRTQV